MLLFVSVIGLKAQDPHFSQYCEAPMLLNPALTAVFDNYRASANYRTQWRGITTPYTTLAASFEMKLDQTPWTKEKSKRVEIYHQSLNKLCAGVQFLTDKAGDGSYKSTLVLLALSKSVQLNKTNSLTLGLQGGVVQRSVNNAAFLWPDQFNGSVYSSSLPTGESFAGDRYTQADFSAGLLWSHGYETSQLKRLRSPKWTAGAALQHLNRARHSFFTAGNGREIMKLTLHSRFEIPLPGNRAALLPEIM
ncbi:MAG: PorP/SprF family type IX secretion system membrane protein, partial [Bacteroidia bacterium]